MKALMHYMGSLETRPVNSSDHAFLRRLYASTRGDLTDVASAPQFVAALLDMQERMQTIAYRQNYPDANYLVLENLGEAVGRLVVNTSASDIRLLDISLLPHARGRGFGTAALRALQRKAVALELPLTLTVQKNNRLARQLYQALGFVLLSCDEATEQLIWRPDTRQSWQAPALVAEVACRSVNSMVS